MNYQLSDETKKFINDTIQKELGISYDEFAALDAEEQNRLMEENRKRQKTKNDKVLTMIGSGENTIFTKVKRGERIMLNDGTIIKAGTTPEDERAKIDKELDEILKNGPRQYNEEPKEKPKQFIKKLFKRK